MKNQILTFALLLGIGACLTSCQNNQNVDGGEQPQQKKSLSDFDWKTTKQVPLHIVSDNNQVSPIFVYSGNTLVASGYTPFEETVTVPASTLSLQVTTMPKNTAKTRSYPGNWLWPIGQVVDVPLAGGGSVTVSGLIDLHADLFVKWAGWQVSGFDWSSFVAYWNAGGTQNSSIILYADKQPYPVADGSLDVEHACLWPQCNHGVPECGAVTVSGTYLFEDLFPFMGDYDMNDMVVEEVVSTKVGLNNKVKEAEVSYTVKAVGGSRKMALALFLPHARTSDIEKVEITKVDPSGKEEAYACANASGLFALNDNLEVSNTDQVVIPLFDNVSKLLRQTVSGPFYNTIPEGGKCDPLVLKVKIVFNAASTVSVDHLTDLFMIPNDAKQDDLVKRRGCEVHLADALPTDKMDRSFFGSGDVAKEGAPRYETFRSKDGYVWAIYLPIINFNYPIEDRSPLYENDLFLGYPQFRSWIESAGTLSQEWYTAPEQSRVWK